VAKLKAQLADMRKVRAESEAMLKEDLEAEEEARMKADGWRRIVEETRRAVYFFKEKEANLEAELKAEEARMKAGR